VFLTDVKYQTVIAAPLRVFGIKNPIIFNSDLKSVFVLSNVDRKYFQCIPKDILK
jgi:hypothetical protein